MFSKTKSTACDIRDINLSDFQTSPQENSMYWNFQEEISSYVFIRLSMHKTRPNDIFLGLLDYFYMTQPTLTQKSNVKYHSVMDAMMAMLHQLHEEYIIKLKQTYLVVEGDAKLFNL